MAEIMWEGNRWVQAALSEEIEKYESDPA